GILHNKPYKFPTRSLTNALLEAIEKDGISSALLQYKEMKNSTDYHFNENEMNLAGYQLLQSHKLKEAEFIFKLVVEASPNSYNAFDSYGESLMVLGDNANAIENYKKSLKLNPGNDNAIKKLKELGINTDGLIKKVPLEDLALLEGEYLVNSPTSEKDKNWKIIFKVIKGELTGNDRGYKYRVMPVSDNEFVNPADGASLLFDTKDKKAITLLLFGKVKFTKLM
ncbi:MAG TPA: hypothetical protein VK590_13535, partial [Saprospiraceae bacterium]|nr:hypothetical protein [Saprospiraceae bacterium]